MRGSTSLSALLFCIAAGCASGQSPDERGLDVIVKARASAVPADASGVTTIEKTTQCKARFVRVMASGAFLVRLWPTHAMPNLQQCLDQLKSLPGVEYAVPDSAMRAS